MNVIMEELLERSIDEVDTVIALDCERVYIRFKDESSLIVPHRAYVMFLDACRYENCAKAMCLLQVLGKHRGEGVRVW